MSTTSFANIDQEKAEKDTAASEAPTTTALSTPTDNGTGGAIATYGEASASSEDINIEHIQIFGRSSHFNPEGGSIGDICYNKETPLVNVGEPIKGVLVHTRKYWKENVPYGEQTTPRFANTLEEKRQIESTTEFDGTVPVCDVVVLLERPDSFTDDEAASSIFIYEFGGKEYALVKYTVQKSQAVRENYGTINVAARARSTKGEDATNYYFDLVSKEKGGGSAFTWHQFILKATANPAPEEAVDFARSLRGGQ